jgi:hypothetical protein
MTEPPGYALETLWEDEKFVLSRGVSTWSRTRGEAR